jgi:hypothetical protein
VEVVPAWIGRMNDDRRLAVVLGVGFILAGPLAGGALAGLRPSDIATGVVCIAGQCLAVAWRRRRPLVALTACCAAVLTPAALVPAVDVGTVTEAAQTVLAALVLYSLLVHGSVRQATVAMSCIASLFVIDVVAALPDRSPATMTAVSSTALEAFVLVALVLVVVLVARARRLDAALLVEQVRHDAALREQGPGWRPRASGCASLASCTTASPTGSRRPASTSPVSAAPTRGRAAGPSTVERSRSWPRSWAGPWTTCGRC